MLTPRAEALLASPFGLELMHLLEWRQEALSSLSDEELFQRANEASSSNRVYRGDYDEHLKFLRSRASNYQEVAEQIARRMSAWWDAIDRRRQVWVSADDRAPDPSLLLLDMRPMHRAASKPIAALWTCTHDAGVSSPWLVWGEHQRGPRSVWQLAAAASARIAEVHSPEDWRNLCVEYPAREPGNRFPWSRKPSVAGVRLDPDWTAVAQEWDGVHLSLGGLLTAQDVPCAREGIVTELRGWDTESTMWTRWVFDSVERLDAPD